MTALNAALAFVIASYATPETRVVETKDRKVRAKKARPASVVSPPIVNALPVEPGKVALSMPEVGSLGAHGFVTMMRRAMDRQEKILAMQAFCGFDPTGDYGSQEMAALMQAKRELSPIDTSGPSLKEERSAKRSALGFIAGMPNNRQKQIQDLLAREKMTVEIMLGHVKDAREATDDSAKQTHAGLAALEKARLNRIQAEIASLTGA